MKSRPASIEERVQRLEDLEEIRQLFTDYGHHLDHANYDAYANLFAIDGELNLGGAGRATGVPAIRTLLEKLLQFRTGTVRHIISSPIVQLNGDQATAEVMWVMLTACPEGLPAIGMIGHHEDILTKKDGNWKFLRREGHIDIGSLPVGRSKQPDTSD